MLPPWVIILGVVLLWDWILGDAEEDIRKDEEARIRAVRLQMLYDLERDLEQEEDWDRIQKDPQGWLWDVEEEARQELKEKMDSMPSNIASPDFDWGEDEESAPDKPPGVDIDSNPWDRWGTGGYRARRIVQTIRGPMWVSCDKQSSEPRSYYREFEYDYDQWREQD